MKILLKCYLQFKFHGTGVIFAMVTMFPHFPPKCGACVRHFLTACAHTLHAETSGRRAKFDHFSPS